MRKPSVQNIVSVIATIFVLIGGLWAFDATCTRAEKFCELEQRVDRRFLSDDARDLQRRMWDLQRFYGEEKAQTLTEYKELQNERESILRNLDAK